MKSLLRVVPIWAALSLTMLLLVLVGIGEARQNFFKFRLDTTTMQSESMLRILRHDLENGTPLASISGLATMAKNLDNSDTSLLGVAFYSENHQLLSCTNPDLQASLQKYTFTPCKVTAHDTSYEVSECDRYVRVSKAIQTRFGPAGSLDLLLEKEYFWKQTAANFEYMAYGAVASVVLLYLIIVMASRRYSDQTKRLKRVVQVSYFILFLFCASVIVQQTLAIYTAAVEYKSQALGNFLAQRLSMASRAGIEFRDLAGINDLLTDFRKEHREICAVDLLVNGQSGYSASATETKDANAVKFTDDDVFAYTFGLDTREHSNLTIATLQLRVKVPKSVIRDAVMDGVVNLLVLLFACSLMANMILEIGITRLSARLVTVDRSLKPAPKDAMASLQASYLIMVFINALTVPFLAPLIKDINGSVASLPFTAYFVCFALFMIPAGKLAERGYTRHLLICGALLEVAGSCIAANFPTLLMLTAGRSLSGLGQGMFLVGFQSFIISITGDDERTQGQSLKVIIRNTVLVSGSAIGALVYVFFDYQVVFLACAALGLVALVHILFVLPDPHNVEGAHFETPQERAARAAAGNSGFRAFLRLFIDREFLSVLLLDGIPAKIAVTGIIMFTVPLLLKDQGVSAEAVGRYLMLYYITCSLFSRWSAKYADASGRTRNLLTWGAVVGGISFMALGGLTSGYLAIPGMDSWMVVLVTVSIFLCGASSGLNSAPIVTHVCKTDAAKLQGQKTMVAVYCFAERFGHVAGPALMVYCSTLTGNMGTAILYFGGVSLLMGLVFQAISRKA